MKRFFLILIVLFCTFVVCADGANVLGSTSKVITAFKNKQTSGVPDPEVQFRLIDSNSIEFAEDGNIQLPLNARKNNYTAFSWILSGNVYGEVTMKFTFGPMYWEDDKNSTEVIPYTVTLRHTSTRIGNTPIKVGSASTAASFTTNDFSTYYYKYADSVVVPGSAISVANSSATANVVSNMSTYTVVQRANGNNVSARQYAYSVCDYWNRYGEAVVNLNITDLGEKSSGGAKFEDGVYYANVKVEISRE